MEEADAVESEAGETEAPTEAIAEEIVDDEDTSQTNPEKTDLDQIVEETEEDLTAHQKAELNTLIEKSNIEIEDLPTWLRAIIYTGKNILNFISKKEYVDTKVDEWLSQNLQGKHIYVALHGMWQTYWSSFADLVEYCENKGIIIIPIKSSSTKNIYNAITDLKQKTGANIHLFCHSRGGIKALDAVIDHGLDKLVQEIILSGTPIHNLDGTLRRQEYAEISKKIKLTNIYGSTDQILSFFGHANYGNLPNANNIKVNEGHLGLLHNPNIFDRYFNLNHYHTLAPKPTIYHFHNSYLKQAA